MGVECPQNIYLEMLVPHVRSRVVTDRTKCEKSMNFRTGSVKNGKRRRTKYMLVGWPGKAGEGWRAVSWGRPGCKEYGIH